VLKKLIQRVTGKGGDASAQPAGDAARAEAQRLLDAYVKQTAVIKNPWSTDFQKLESAKAIAAADEPTKVRLVELVARRLRDETTPQITDLNDKRAPLAAALHDLLPVLVRAPLRLDAAAIDAIIQRAGSRSVFAIVPAAGIMRAVESYIQSQALTDSHRSHLAKLKSRLLRDDNTAANRKLCQRIDALLAGKTSARGVANLVEPERGEPWADALRADLEKASGAQRDAWQRLLNHAFTANGSKPSAKWVKTAGELIDGIGRDEFTKGLANWLTLVGKPCTVVRKGVHDPTIPGEHSADVLKGFAWSMAAVNTPAMTALLGDLAEVCFKKIPGIGARSPKVANACLAALALMPGPDAVGQLSRIQAKAKKKSARRLVEKALATSAGKQGVSPEELEEMSVPDFGFDAAGRRSVPIGEWSAEIQLAPRGDVELRWRKAGAVKSQASVPADVKRDHADALKDLRRAMKDIERVAPAQVARVERLLLDDRDWPIDVWRTRYLDHALVSQIARRVIWQLNGREPLTFTCREGAFVNAEGKRIDLPRDGRVRLWHPISASPDDVLAWRRYLESNGITQPFKQAHREVYVLTDAERETGTYSNRFAAHVLRQHQFQALCDARGWSYHLQGGFDSHNVPTRTLRRQGIRVEFWVEGVTNHMSESGIFLYATTDQVRFHREGADRPMTLEEVPPRVFSELMRDVDLFVGVASVGNDPAWRDRGEDFGQYWQEYSFGELSATAQTRRDVLSRLLPRLKIADRATLQARFLVIRGDLRTYKIHLGSSNIQIEPNNQYLCIVADRGQRAVRNDDIFLPFEGDHTLAVILSKAFMLADDKRITDPTITRQIHRV